MLTTPRFSRDRKPERPHLTIQTPKLMVYGKTFLVSMRPNYPQKITAPAMFVRTAKLCVFGGAGIASDLSYPGEYNGGGIRPEAHARIGPIVLQTKTLRVTGRKSTTSLTVKPLTKPLSHLSILSKKLTITGQPVKRTPRRRRR